MKEVDMNNIKCEDLVNYQTLSEAFKNYLMNVLGYDEGEANFVIASDFGDPYNTPYIVQEYDSEVIIDGKHYEVRYCYTDFDECGLFDFSNFPPFKFYMLFNLESMPDRTVGSYMCAEKSYLL